MDFGISMAAASGQAALVACQDLLTKNRRLEDERDLLTGVLSNLSVAIVVTNAHHEVVHWSMAAERLTGRTSSSVLGRSCGEAIGCGMQPRTCSDQCGMLHALRRRPLPEPQSVEIVHADGNSRELVSHAVLLPTVGHVVSELREPNAESKAQQDLGRVAAQMAEARAVQERMLEMVEDCAILEPGNLRVEIEAFNSPSLEVGGDFYQVFRPDPSRLVVAIGDVVGKGVASGMIAAVILTIMEEAVGSRSGCQAMLQHVNQRLCRLLSGGPKSFVTAMVIEIDAGAGVYRMARSGHELALLHRRGRCREGARVGGLPLGIVPDASYPETVIPCVAGDRLLLYTDGLSEAEVHPGRALGKRGLMRILRQAVAGRSARTALLDTLSPTSLPGRDDATFVAIRLDRAVPSVVEPKSSSVAHA